MHSQQRCTFDESKMAFAAKESSQIRKEDSIQFEVESPNKTSQTEQETADEEP
jgi:DNA-directed RNA polymerase subunit E'/Rpb7